MREGEWELFATDPRGFRVLCSSAQMDYIYKHHPELANFWATEEDMKLAIEKASVIYQSILGEDCNVYYRSKKNRNAELKVVVKFDENNIGKLWGAQPSTVGKRKNGEAMIWPGAKP